jgi:hypothetical protein
MRREKPGSFFSKTQQSPYEVVRIAVRFSINAAM